MWPWFVSPSPSFCFKGFSSSYLSPYKHPLLPVPLLKTEHRSDLIRILFSVRKYNLWITTFPGCNRPFRSCLKPLFPSEAKCGVIDMKMILYSHANKIHFHSKGFALSLVSKVRVFGTWKWSFSFPVKSSAPRIVANELPLVTKMILRTRGTRLYFIQKVSALTFHLFSLPSVQTKLCCCLI